MVLVSDTGEVVVDKCRGKPFGYGYNAATDTYEDLMASGVLDPAKVSAKEVVLSAKASRVTLRFLR